MKEKLLESHYVQADETMVVVVDSKGEDTKAKKYMPWSKELPKCAFLQNTNVHGNKN